MSAAAHDAVMALLVAGILTMTAAQLLDLASFMRMMQTVGLGAEANPLVATMFELHGFPMVAVAKIALLVLVSAIVVIARAGRPRLSAGIVALGIMVGLLGGLSNVVALGLI